MTEFGSRLKPFPDCDCSNGAAAEYQSAREVPERSPRRALLAAHPLADRLGEHYHGMRWTLFSLNTRETAILVWVVVSVAVALSKADLRGSIFGLIKLLTTTRILAGLILAAAVFVAGVALTLRWAGDWESSMTLIAVVWFLSFGVVALFKTNNVDAAYFRHLVLRNLGMAVLVEFIVNLHTFPLPVELVLVPLSILLVLMQVVAAADPNLQSAQRVLAWLVAVPGVIAIVYSAVYFATHVSRVVNAEKGREFFLPFVLTVGFLPVLVLARYFVVWQTMLHMIEAGMEDDPRLDRTTRRLVVGACGLSLAKAQLFESEYRGRLWGTSTTDEVRDTVERFKGAWQSGQRVKVEAEVPEG